MNAGARDAGPRLDAAARDVAPRPPAINDGPPAPEVGGAAQPCKYAFCESFESYADGASPSGGPAGWVREHKSLVVGSQFVVRGQRALHVPMLTFGQHFIRTTKPFPALAGAFYGRLFLRFEAEPQAKPPKSVYHWTAAELSERPTGYGEVVRTVGGLSQGAGSNPLFFNIETHGDGETGRTDSRAKLATHVWHCLEFCVDRAKSEARTWWNGQERAALAWPDPKAPSADPRWIFPEWKSFSVGLAEYQETDVPWDAWIDEVALHTERIGCE